MLGFLSPWKVTVEWELTGQQGKYKIASAAEGNEERDGDHAAAPVEDLKVEREASRIFGHESAQKSNRGGSDSPAGAGKPLVVSHNSCTFEGYNGLQSLN